MPLSIDFTGKLVVVTGGGRGIGFAIAKALAKGGADVAITYTSQDCTSQAEELSSQYKVKVRAYKCEVTNSKSVDQMVEAVQEDYGKQVDIGIANAGISLWKDALSNTDEDFQNLFQVNTYGPFYLARALVRSWLNLPITVPSSSQEKDVDVVGIKDVKLGKQILFVSSISGIVAMNPQRQTAYNASKGAVTMMAKSLAAEWANIGVTVNSVSPGYVATDMITKSDDPRNKAYAEEWNKRTPVGRFANPDELGEFIAVLVSDKQGGMGFMTGSDVIVDGGYLVS